jgi:hypothetical protein
MLRKGPDALVCQGSGSEVIPPSTVACECTPRRPSAGAPGAVGRLDRYLAVICIVPVIALLASTQGFGGKSLSKSFMGSTGYTGSLG